MLKDCNYNKIRLLHDLSRINNFIKKHAKEDAEKAKGHEGCRKVYAELEKDLEKHINKLSRRMMGMAKKGKFK
jgi:hypothetical protein